MWFDDSRISARNAFYIPVLCYVCNKKVVTLLWPITDSDFFGTHDDDCFYYHSWRNNVVLHELCLELSRLFLPSII